MATDLVTVLVDPVPRPHEPVSQAAVINTALFAITAFVGAGLLFVVQPMIAKLLLPSYGGSATVWSTSSLFFQLLLLAAYGYAHESTRRFGSLWQPRLHLILLVLPVLALPITLPSDAAPGDDALPAVWLLRTLLLIVGLPFVVVATTGPLLQKWYSWTDGRRADDPYFLFAAGNLGSFGGLLAYPLVLEPHLSLEAQRLSWSVGFGVFLMLTATCGLVTMRGQRNMRSALPDPAAFNPSRLPLGRKRILYWAGLAFLPSTLMLGVTSHISTDVAAIPLLWVVPLAIYLATFVIAFARSTRALPVLATKTAVVAALVTAMLSLASNVVPITVAVVANLLLLAFVAYAAHARLAADRPDPEHLTTFYLVVAAGGALGGMLNGLLAPTLFDRVLEYPLAVLLVPVLLVGIPLGGSSWLTRQLRANAIRSVIAMVCMLLIVSSLAVVTLSAKDSPVLVFGALLAGCLLAWWVAEQPILIFTGILALCSALLLADTRGTLEQTRTFFGSYRVVGENGVHRLIHGTTTHGTQLRNSKALRKTPTTYYSEQGPLGEIFDLNQFDRVAAVGLGTGTVAAYGQAGQSMAFFEIDPEIVRMASDPSLFSYLADSRADIQVVVGDGRLEVARFPESSFDLLILDAFSSDSIPVHLLTVEAMRMYADRLAPGGLLVVHISSRVFDLRPVLAGSAHELGWHATVARGSEGRDGATPSEWVATSSNASRIDELQEQPDWRELGERTERWTDDYSSILSVLR